MFILLILVMVATWFKGYHKHNKASKKVQLAGLFKWPNFLMAALSLFTKDISDGP